MKSSNLKTEKVAYLFTNEETQACPDFALLGAPGDTPILILPIRDCNKKTRLTNIDLLKPCVLATNRTPDSLCAASAGPFAHRRLSIRVNVSKRGKRAHFLKLLPLGQSQAMLLPKA
jgi:hypothetical protein